MTKREEFVTRLKAYCENEPRFEFIQEHEQYTDFEFYGPVVNFHAGDIPDDLIAARITIEWNQEDEAMEKAYCTIMFYGEDGWDDTVELPAELVAQSRIYIMNAWMELMYPNSGMSEKHFTLPI